jgi:predicted Zn finger-like uncharacterized protein
VYTQCSKCETVFRLSAEVLRAASGQVRCGKCGEVFSALARLAEDSSTFSAGESPLEMETRADSILGTAAALEVVQAAAKDQEEFGPPGVEIAQLEILDAEVEDESDRSMEFTLPPGELDRIFVESKKLVPPAPPQPDADADADADADPDAHVRTDVHPHVDIRTDVPIDVRTDVPADVRTDVPADVPAHHADVPAPANVRADADADTEVGVEVAIETKPGVAPDLAPHPESAVVNTPPSHDRVSGLVVPDDVRRDMLAGFEPRVRRESVARNRARLTPQHRLILWLGAAIVSALLLMAQMVHQNREWFVAHAHGPFGGVVRALYGAMGAPLPQPANLSAYQLRQWGVTGDPDANGTLRLRASILNTAPQLQPYPLLRVTLADRFGKSIGARDFEPTEYLGKPTARLLTPGERVDATLEILDPGKNAEGFEIDVCVRGVDKRISCANDVAAQTMAR